MTAISESAADYLPRKLTLPAARASGRGLQGCRVYRDATLTVFGEGPADAQIVLVGETPGDQEDQRGSLLSDLRARCSTRLWSERGSIVARFT